MNCAMCFDEIQVSFDLQDFFFFCVETIMFSLQHFVVS